MQNHENDEAKKLEFRFREEVQPIYKRNNVYRLDLRPRVGGKDLYSILKGAEDICAFVLELVNSVARAFDLKKHGLVIDSLETLYLTTRQPRQILQLLRCIAL